MPSPAPSKPAQTAPRALVEQPLPPARNSDLVDRLIEYIKANQDMLHRADALGATQKWAAIAEDLRREFGGQEAYVRQRATPPSADEVLRLFNGRNASEVARRLGIGRASVYRIIKRPGRSAR